MAVGQFLGPRGKFVYESDSGDLFILQMDASLGGITELALPAYTNQAVVGKRPVGLVPRVVHWKSTVAGDNSKKALICNPASALYTSLTGTALPVDGVAGIITGRTGEKCTY